MSFYKNQDLDFVIRTKKLIKQYDSFQIDKNDKFEVTLLINCCVGLLILPQQRLFNNLPEELIDKKNWGISPQEISVMINRHKKTEKKNIKNIARHLRNSVAHYRFAALPKKIEDITEINFKDYLNDKSTLSFEVTVKIDDLKIFANKISNHFITIMKNS